MSYETISVDFEAITARLELTAPIAHVNGSVDNCLAGGVPQGFSSADARRTLRFEPPSSAGRYALEFSVPLSGALSCYQHVVAGWVRAEFEDLAPSEWEVLYNASTTTLKNGTTIETNPATYNKLRVNSMNQTLAICSPELLQVEAKVEVTGDGRIVRSWAADDVAKPVDNPAFIRQVNNFITDNGVTWHSNNTVSDWVSYLVAEANKTTKLLDVNEPVPAFEDAAMNLEAMNRRLVAILIAQNFPLLFEAAEDGTMVNGTAQSAETRIFVSFPAFVTSLVIMCLYVLTTIWLYVRRPWRFLPRLPTSLAATIAYVAPSNALKYMSMYDTEEDRAARKHWKWGYGAYIGPDGKHHTGVERQHWLLQDEKERT